MDELFRLLAAFMQDLPQVLDQFDEQELAQVNEFLQTIAQFLESQQQPEEPQQVEPPIPQGADLLWILSNGDPQAFTQYLRTYPGQGLQALANNPSQLLNVINRLQQENPQQPIGEDRYGIPNTEFSSSNVAGMKYDPQSKQLMVKFHGQNGEPIYSYDNVPPFVFNMLQHGKAFAQTKGRNQWGEWWPMKNPSIGAAVDQYLKKGGFPYQRIA